MFLYTKNNSSGIPVPMIQYKVVEVKGVITEDFKKRGCWRCIKNMRCNAEQQYATYFAQTIDKMPSVVNLETGNVDDEFMIPYYIGVLHTSVEF